MPSVVPVYHRPPFLIQGGPPCCTTIIAAVDALALWSLIPRAQTLLGYWLDHFVRPDGTIDYYGPSLSEYGQLLTTAGRLMACGGDPEWFARHRPALQRLADLVQGLAYSEGEVALLAGVPEADEGVRPATYFHNNAWVVRGLNDWTVLTDQPELRSTAERLRQRLLAAIEDTWPRDPGNWWLRPTVERL